MEQSNHGYQTAKIHVAPQIHFRIVFFHYVTIYLLCNGIIT